jgi:hypothetical protein
MWSHESDTEIEKWKEYQICTTRKVPNIIYLKRWGMGVTEFECPEEVFPKYMEYAKNNFK